MERLPPLLFLILVLWTQRSTTAGMLRHSRFPSKRPPMEGAKGHSRGEGWGGESVPSLGVFVDTHSPEVAGAVNAAVTQLNEENTSHSSDSQATIMNIVSAERYERPGTRGKASAMRIKVQLRRENGRMEFQLLNVAIPHSISLDSSILTGGGLAGKSSYKLISHHLIRSPFSMRSRNFGSLIKITRVKSKNIL